MKDYTRDELKNIMIEKAKCPCNNMLKHSLKEYPNPELTIDFFNKNQLGIEFKDINANGYGYNVVSKPIHRLEPFKKENNITNYCPYHINPEIYTTDFHTVFAKSRSAVEQIDADFPEYTAIAATKDDFSHTPTPIGMYVVNDEVMHKLLMTDKNNTKKLEKFTLSHYTIDTRKCNSAIVEFYNRNIKDGGDNSNITFKVCQDQEGSRFIQNQLDSWSGKDIVEFFSEIEPFVLDLSMNLFGNYVIQKIIPLLTVKEYDMLCKRFSGSIYLLSTHIYGCRVIQKLIDFITDITFIISELQDHILELIASPNGNHVIQKCIDRSIIENKIFINNIINEFEKDCISLSQQRYGCRVLQRLFEISAPEKVDRLLGIIVDNIQELINDRYGNYVIQHLIQSNYKQKEIIFKYIISNAVELSRYKFSSNVIEKCVVNASKRELEQFLESFAQLAENNKPALFYMCTDMYANYVVQKFFDTVDDDLKMKMKAIIGKYLKDIKAIPFTKHILNKFDK